MKKFIIILMLSICSVSAMNLAFAADEASKPIEVIVTEDIPGGKCECIAEENISKQIDEGGGRVKNVTTSKTSCSNPATRKYKCTVQSGLIGFQKTFAAIIKYVIYIVMLLGVLGVVGLGIAWTFAGGDDIKMKSSLKKWGVNILVGLTILFLFSYILRFLAPWVYQ